MKKRNGKKGKQNKTRRKSKEDRNDNKYQSHADVFFFLSGEWSDRVNDLISFSQWMTQQRQRGVIKSQKLHTATRDRTPWRVMIPYMIVLNRYGI